MAGQSYFDILLGFIGAFSAFCTGIALVGHERRRRVHVVLGIFFLNIGAAFFMRSMNWQTEGDVHIGYAYSLFAIMPLLFCVFVENLIHRPVSSRMKFGIVIAMSFFILTTWSEPIRTSTPWRAAFMFYHLFSMGGLLLPLRRYAKQIGVVEQERHVINSIFVVVGFSLFFIALEWLYILGPLNGQAPRMSGLALLIFCHNLTSIYFNEHRFNLRKEVIGIASFLAFAFVTMQVLTIAGISLGPFWVGEGLIFAVALTFSTFNLQVVSSFSSSGISRLITQLVSADKSNAPFFMRSLAKVAEFQKLRLVRPDIVEALDCDRIYSFLNKNQVYSQQTLRRMSQDHDLAPVARDAFTAALYLLISINANAMIITGNGGEILVASPVALRSTRYFDALLLWAAQTLDLVRRASPAVTAAAITEKDLAIASIEEVEVVEDQSELSPAVTL